MSAPTVGVPARRITRLDDLTAAELHIGDYVHDDLVPFVVAGFRSAPDHVVAIVARLASGTDITVRYLTTHKIDVSRVTDVPTGRPPARRRHLTLCPPVGGQR